MGQAFRRAAGRLRSTSIDTSTTSSTPPPPTRYRTSFDKTPPAVPTHTNRVNIQHQDSTSEGDSKSNAEELEGRDANYDAMLNQMVGRISTKPGGMPEMGEAFVVRKSNRPMPKLRNTTTESGRYEERPVAAGTLNVAQLRYIMRLHQGKAEDHDGAVNLKEIAQQFRLDPGQVEKIFSFVSLPPEDKSSKRQHELGD